jgi:MinD-like ATPase involved in chromosome partitioning or flagellar assembly
MASDLDDDDFDVVPLLPNEDSGGEDIGDRAGDVGVGIEPRPRAHAERRIADPRTGAFLPEVALPSTLAPDSGWRRALWKLSGSSVKLVSPRERHLAERIAVLRRPLWGPWAIAVLSMKGGVGKTTTCVGVGHVFAAHRGDLVIAADFDADGGQLAQRVGQEARFTISDLLASPSRFEDRADIGRYTCQAPTRLQVLAANRDPWAAAALDASLYRRTRAILGIHYSVILLDCGTGLLTDAAQAAVEVADQVVVVASAAFDAAEVGYRTLEWLDRQGHSEKVREAVVVLNTLEQDGRIRMDVVERAFLAHCRAVVRVPRDPHLRLGTPIELGDLQRATWEAWVELAATLAEGFRL